MTYSNPPSSKTDYVVTEGMLSEMNGIWLYRFENSNFPSFPHKVCTAVAMVLGRLDPIVLDTIPDVSYLKERAIHHYQHATCTRREPYFLERCWCMAWAELIARRAGRGIIHFSFPHIEHQFIPRNFVPLFPEGSEPTKTKP